MTIAFNDIPSTIRVPFTYVEFDSSRAVQGVRIQPYKVLVLGQRLAAGTVAALVPTRVTSAAQASTLFGAGSILHGMAIRLFQNNSFNEAWFCAQDDAGGATAATSTITVTGTPTAAGTVYLYIAGRRLQAAVAISDSVTVVAAAISAAINADTTLPVTAVPTLGVVALTAKNKGLVGNDLDIRLNYYEGESTPTGSTVTLGGVVAGTGSVSLATTWAAIGDEHYNLIANPYIDAASFVSIEAEVSDRWGPLRQIEAVVCSAHSGDHSTVGAFGAARNSPHSVIMSNYKSPTPFYEWAAALAGVLAFNGNQDPARPFQTLELKGCLPPLEVDRFTLQERNLLLFDGIATSKVDAGGLVRIERAITTYQTNSAGADDTAFLDVNTPLTLGFLRYDFRNFWATKYPRHKLANDGTRFGLGQAIMTPKVAKAECVAKFRQWELIGLVEGIDQFKNDLIVERNISDPNRLDILMPPDLVNQLRVTGVQIAFLL